MSPSLRSIVLAAVLALCFTAAVPGQANANPVPDKEQVAMICGAWQASGFDATLFRAIAQGDAAAAAAAAGAWRHARDYGPLPGPICWAIQFGSLEMVNALVSSGLPTSETYDPGMDDSRPTGVVYQALASGHPEIARLLVEHGTDADAAYLLRYAVRHGDAELFAFALKNVPAVDAKPQGYHTTALMDAAAAGRMDFVTALVSRGADVDAPPDLPAPGDLVENRPDELQVESPLAAALRGGHVDVARFLLSRNAEPGVGGLDGALRMGQGDLADDFLRRGVRPEGSSLVAACSGNLPQFVSRFLAQGLSPYSEDSSGDAAADVAFRSHYGAILKMLTDRGAKPAVFFLKVGTVNDDRVNLRDLPDVKHGKVLRKLSRGDEVQILKKTVEEETISGRTSVWYRLGVPYGDVGQGTQSPDVNGWVFGAYVDVQ